MSTQTLFSMSPMRCAVLVLLIGSLAGSKAFTAENEPLPVPNPDQTNSIELLRSYLQLQEQLHGLQLSMEEDRKAAEAAATRNASAVADRLQALEQTLAAERSRDLDTLRSSNNVMLTVSATFGAVGLLAMLLMAYQWRTVSRLAEISARDARNGLGTGPALPALNAGDSRLLVSGGEAEQSTVRLLEAVNRLEKRILQIEDHAHSPVTVADTTQPMLPMPEMNPPPAAGAPSESAESANGKRVTMLLGKGQTLLNLDKAEEAMGCFDEILSLEPNHAEALLKKAMALERLRKVNEALECYDRAIAADNSLTMAYLYKGGLFNRMERFGEALECYELALRTQEKA